MATLLVLLGTGATDTVRIRVGPDLLVSRDGNGAHTEAMVAVNPKDWRNIVAVSHWALSGTPVTVRAYSSRDGGTSWAPSLFPEADRVGAGDPQVAFTPQGTALFAALHFVPDQNGGTRGGLYVYRSEDGGFTWSKPTAVGSLHHSYDHEQIVVDTTTDRFAGRIYIGVLYGKYPEYTVGVLRSVDDGRTWTGPVRAASGQGKTGINVVTPLVMADGTLIVPYADFAHSPETRKRTRTSTHWMVTSTDGGISFQPPKPIVTQHFPQSDDLGQLGTFAQFAVDASAGPHRDRLHVVWADFTRDGWRLHASYSADRGTTWSSPRLVDPTVPLGAHQFQPAAVVNKDGVLGVTWFDSRAGQGLYDQYFAASTDGGETFLPAERVSSASSMPRGAGNLTLTPTVSRVGADTIVVALFSPASRWGNGGDYMGLSADSRGVFRLMWVDSRSGTFQLYSAEVCVDRDAPAWAATGGVPTVMDLSGKVELVFDPVRYDSARRIAELPVRLRNLTDSPIQGPVTVEIRGFPTWGWEVTPPRVLNATNRRPGPGAIFDYTGALGNTATLPPRGLTAAVVWRLELANPMQAPSLQIVVTGGVQGSR